MGTSYEFRCSECEYSVSVSGGRDVGMFAVVMTQMCLDCKEIVDVRIGSYGLDGPTGDPEIDKDLNVCPNCKGFNLCVWTAKHPCPKCGGRMDEGDGPVVMWD